MIQESSGDAGWTGARSSVRNAGLLMVQWTLHVCAAGIFALLIPRMMGPAVFGRYALLTSVAMWFGFLSSLGALTLLTRTVPQLLSAGDLPGVKKLATSLATLRALLGSLAALAYAVLVYVAFDFDEWRLIAIMAAAVWCRAAANVCFALFMGLGRAARWGAGELVRRWLTLAFVVVGYPVAGLEGAVTGFFLANLLVLGVGVVQAWPYFEWAQVDLSRRYLGPYLRIGTAFAVGNLLFGLNQRSGEAIVTLWAGDYAEVGYFSAAYAIYLTLAQALWHFAIAFSPFLVRQLTEGRREVVTAWLERLLKWMAMGAALAAAGLITLGGDLLPALLGPAFQPVVANVIPLALALFTMAVNNVGRLMALVLDRPRTLAVAAGLELGVLWVLGSAGASREGSFAVCLAVLVASASYGLWITWSLRGILPWSPRAAFQAVGLAVVFVPLAWLDGPPALSIALFAGAALAYAGLAWRIGLVTMEEFAAIRQLARPPREEE